MYAYITPIVGHKIFFPVPISVTNLNRRRLNLS